MHHPTDRITHTTAFVTPVVEHWVEREIAPWRIDPTTHRTMSERSTSELRPAPSHVCMHAYLPSYLPTYIHTYIYEYLHTYIHIYVRTYMHTYIQTNKHTYIYTYIHNVSVAEWLAWLTSNCGRIGAIGSISSNGLKQTCETKKDLIPFLSDRSFTICVTPYNRKIKCVECVVK